MGLAPIKARLSVSNWAKAVVGALVCISAFLSGLEAFAGGLGTTGTMVFPGSQPAWTDSSKYVECGQDCLYQKGNENITLQAIYIIKKMDNLERVLDGAQDNDYNQVITELKIYCPEVSAGSVDEGEAKTCYKRYVQTQLPILRAMKATMIKNEDMTAQLKSDQGAFGGGSRATAIQDETPGQRKAQTPDFSKEAELMTPEAGAKLKYLSQENYAQWTAQVSNLAPKREDFPRTTLVKKDPSDPSSIMVNKISRDNLGNPIINEEAFQLAQKEYNTHVLGNASPKQLVEYDLTKVSKPYGKSKLGDIDPSMLAQQPKGKPTPSAIQDISYRQARNLVLESEANLFQRGVMPTKTFSGAQRAPGSAPNAKATPKPATPGLGFDETVIKQLSITKEAVVNPVPKNGTNTTYSVTLSPEQLDKQITEFQKSADAYDVKN